MTEDHQGHRLTDILEVHFLELPKLSEEGVPIREDDAVVQWMMFIDGRSEETMEMLAAKNRHIGSALDYLKLISQDEKARMAYEAREAELMDQRTRIKSAYIKGEESGIRKGEEIGIRKGEEIGIKKGEEIGIKKGEEKGKAEIIHAMLSKGMSVEEIASIISVDVRSVIEMISARTNSM